MRFKGKIWEYSNLGEFGGASLGSIKAIKCYDPYIFKFVKMSFNKEKLFENKLNIILGSELTKSWLDDNFLSLGLFGNEESFLVQNAQDIPSDIQDTILEQELLLDNRFLILNFTKECSLWSKIQKSKKDHIKSFNIVAPAFWEEQNLLRYMADKTKVNLSYELSEFITQYVPFELSEYDHILNQVKIINDTKANCLIEDIKEFIEQEKLDQFSLIELFATKKLRAFYIKLNHLSQSGQDLISFFYLAQSHFLKMYDTSVLTSKAKLSKYDKSIISQKKSWKDADIKRVINYFSELLTMAKVDKDALERKLKSDRIKLIK